MVKVSIHSITAPGPAVENMAKQDPSSQPTPLPLKPQKIEAPQNIELPTQMPAPSTLPPLELPRKTEGSGISMEDRLVSANVSNSDMGVKTKNEREAIPQTTEDRYSRKTKDNVRGLNAQPTLGKSSLESAKYAAFDRAEVLSLLPRSLSKDVAERLSRVLVKAAYANAPQAGQQAVPRTPEGKRKANASAVLTTGSPSTRLPDGAEQMSMRKSFVQTPALDKLLERNLRPDTMTKCNSTKAAALVTLARSGLQKQAVLDFIRASDDKKAALRTLGRMSKTAESLHTRELMQQDGTGIMPSGPRGPVPNVLTQPDRKLAEDWYQRLDPISRLVPGARVTGRRKGSTHV